VVLGCSVVLAMNMPDEWSPYAAMTASIARAGQAIVPAHWQVEIANSLLVAHRKNRIVQSQLKSIMAAIGQISRETEASAFESLRDAVVPLALKHRLTVYDAIYLEVATRRGALLATLDKELAGAAREEGAYPSANTSI